MKKNQFLRIRKTNVLRIWKAAVNDAFSSRYNTSLINITYFKVNHFVFLAWTCKYGFGSIYIPPQRQIQMYKVRFRSKKKLMGQAIIYSIFPKPCTQKTPKFSKEGVSYPWAPLDPPLRLSSFIINYCWSIKFLF